MADDGVELMKAAGSAEPSENEDEDEEREEEEKEEEGEAGKEEDEEREEEEEEEAGKEQEQPEQAGCHTGLTQDQDQVRPAVEAELAEASPEDRARDIVVRLSEQAVSAPAATSPTGDRAAADLLQVEVPTDQGET